LEDSPKAKERVSAVLIKLRFDEIAGQDSLNYDVLDGLGQVVFKAGEPIKAGDLKKKAASGLFRQQEKLPIEWVICDDMPTFRDPEALQKVLKEEDNLAEELKLPYLLDREEATPYLDSMFYFWKKLEDGVEIDIALLEVLEHKLIASIVTRMEEIRYLNQLRIRDGITYSHTLDVTALSIALGSKLGLSNRELKDLALGALLHDLGKLFIPKPIMFKSTRLTDKEFEVMQIHPEIGYRIIKEKLKMSDDIARPALEHQELYTGGGYPQNISRDQIHYYSQIVKVADVYDALTSRRPYKEAISSHKAIKIMLLEGAKSFNPKILRSFLEVANYPDGIPEDLKQY
jgi:HD-GYP domain-containing protein (c-di-GMP phosphodiesterase class II)